MCNFTFASSCIVMLNLVKLYSNVLIVGSEGEESLSVKNEELFRK
jgi:hypothetical protein